MLPRELVTSQETGSVKNEWSTMTSYVSPETSLIILPPFAHLVTRIEMHSRDRDLVTKEKSLKRKKTRKRVHTFSCQQHSFVWINHHPGPFLCFGLSTSLWQLSTLWQAPRWIGADSTFLVMPERRGSSACQWRKTKLKNDKRVAPSTYGGVGWHPAVFLVTAEGNKLTEVSIKNTCLCL